MLTQIINPFRTIPFNMKDQFGLAYGGLRGAISFALAFTLPDNIGRKQLFVTATIAIILFTVFLQVRESLCGLIRNIFTVTGWDWLVFVTHISMKSVSQ